VELPAARGQALQKTVHGAEQNRKDIARWRYWWKKYQNRIDPSRLVFIDETWAKTNMAPIHGWGQKGLTLPPHLNPD
jgi:hypothetical protein